MTLVIATATPKEMEAVLAGFNGRGRCCCMPGVGDWCSTPVNGHDCLLAVTGIGPINTAISIGRIMVEFPRVTGVLNFGIAGSFDTETAPLGTPVLANAEVYPEYGLATSNCIDPRGIKFPQWNAAEGGAGNDKDVWDTIELTPKESLRTLKLNTPPHVAGTSLSVAGVTGTTERAVQLKQRYTALTENMEGFSLALACVQAGIPFVELRTISNVVGSRDRADWDIELAFTRLGQAARELFV